MLWATGPAADLCESLAVDKERMEGELSQQAVAVHDLEAALREQQRLRHAVRAGRGAPGVGSETPPAFRCARLVLLVEHYPKMVQ